MDWWQTLIVTLSTIIVTKGIDIVVTVITQKKDFDKFKRQKIYEEIDALRDEVGIIYELAANWEGYQQKEQEYMRLFIKRNTLVGKYNKYKTIADSARWLIHWATIVAAEESRHGDVDKAKDELHKAHALFIDECDNLLKKV